MLLVPIYEARVLQDLRIVYQIDLDTDIDTKVRNHAFSILRQIHCMTFYFISEDRQAE